MNDFIALIKSRRSIRKYTKQPIKDSDLKTIMECAIMAPTAMRQQKWYFSVVQNPAFISRMIEVTRENLINSGVEFLAEQARNPGFNPYHGAGIIITVFADGKAKFAQTDAALAAENILLAATALNIGSCIATSPEFLFNSDKGRQIKKEMGVPDNYVYVCTITLGYPDESPPAPPRDPGVIKYIK